MHPTDLSLPAKAALPRWYSSSAVFGRRIASPRRCERALVRGQNIDAVEGKVIRVSKCAMVVDVSSEDMQLIAPLPHPSVGAA